MNNSYKKAKANRINYLLDDKAAGTALVNSTEGLEPDKTFRDALPTAPNIFLQNFLRRNVDSKIRKIILVT